MTKHEINELLGLSSTTLGRWSETDNQKNKLYKLLENIDKETANQAIHKKPSHRIFHILNRNIKPECRFSYAEIRNAFLKKDYLEATERERTIYASFFKELETNDLETFIEVFKVTKRYIKKIYAQIPERKFKGVAKVWDRRFRLKHIKIEESQKNTIPLSLQRVLDKRL